MNLCDSTVTLHPQAHDFLFKYYRLLRRIFGDVLGQLEMNYISINLLTAQNELLFLSSKPSLEHNLIENQLWQYDLSFQTDFFLQNMVQLWTSLYHADYRDELRYYKQDVPKLSIGVAIPSFFNGHRVVYSFATSSSDKTMTNKIINQIVTLQKLGQFCLQRIVRSIQLPIALDPLLVRKSVLKLIVNNEERG